MLFFPSRAVSLAEALQICGHTVYVQSRRTLGSGSYLHAQVLSETSDVISYILSSLVSLADPGQSLHSCGWGCLSRSYALGGQQGKTSPEPPSKLLLGHNSRKFLSC